MHLNASNNLQFKKGMVGNTKLDLPLIDFPKASLADLLEQLVIRLHNVIAHYRYYFRFILCAPWRDESLDLFHIIII